MSSSGTYDSPCAACKFLRRKCIQGCALAPYFPPEETHKFFNVHKIFGAGNITKLLNEIQPSQRKDAVNSLAYEAEARVRDPVYGCVASISYLQRQVHRLQKELDAANAYLTRYGYTAYNSNNNSYRVMINDQPNSLPNTIQPSPPTLRQRQSVFVEGMGGGFYQGNTCPYPLPGSTADHYWDGDEGRGGGRGGNI